MKDRLSNLLLVLLLLLPLLAINSGWQEVSGILARWKNQEQERFASNKLGEIAANIDLSQHLAEHALRYRQGIASLLLEYPHKKPEALPFRDLAESVFSRPFPVCEVWAFAQNAEQKKLETVYVSEKSASRRPMEMVLQALIDENRELPQKADEYRRNEKLLQKIFGNGCSIGLLAIEQRGIVTPIIYRRIPSFLVWDYTQNPDGKQTGFFLIVPRNQDLDACAMRLAARKAGLDAGQAGGFVRIFADGSPDCLFPQRLARSRVFKGWRDRLGTVEENLDVWEKNGFPWAVQLGNARLYTRILPLEKHLAVLLLPAGNSQGRPLWLQIFNLTVSVIILMLALRGLILGLWPFVTINSRFAVVFLLAATLPAALFVTSATAYIFERYKADENRLEETLVTSLSDFDAGKDSLENEYLSVFAEVKTDAVVNRLLADRGIAGSGEAFKRIRDIVSTRADKISISGMALFDLAGNLDLTSEGNLRKSGFETLAKFYGLPFTLSLRRVVAREEPGLVLPFHKIDQNNLMAMQSFKRRDTIDTELDKYRGKVVRSDMGRGYLGYMNDYITIGGLNRFVLMLAWLESDVDRVVIRRSADQLTIKAPEIKLAAFKRTVVGDETLLRPDRSFTGEQLKACRRVADSAFSIKSGILKTSAAGMSIVAYASRHFDRTVLIGAIDHARKDSDHLNRVVIFVSLGILALFMIFASAIAVWIRIVRPLKAIKGVFDEVESGRLVNLPAVARADEIGLLNSEFNSMVKGLEERHRLASMLSEHAVKAVASASRDGKIVSEKFAGVVLVTDIRSFTTMCEQQTVGQVTALLNTHVTEMATVINKFGGKIYKFIGDAIEAVFVDDFHYHYSPGRRAVMAGAAMLQKLQEINDSRRNEGLFDYAIGIGLAAGELIAGEIGSRFSRRDYAMFGNAFKRAAEFEAMTKQFKEWPMIADHHVVDAVEKLPLEWGEVRYGAEFVFNLKRPAKELIEKFCDTTIDATVADSRPKQVDMRAGKRFVSSEIALENSGNSQVWRVLAFWAGLFCILFPLLAWTFSYETGRESRKIQAKKNDANFCESLLARLKVQDSQRIMLEQHLENLCEDIVPAQAWCERGFTASQLASASNLMADRIRETGLRPSLFAVLHKPGGAENAAIDENWRLLHYAGASESRALVLELMQTLAMTNYSRSDSIGDALMPRVGKMFGTSMDFRWLANDSYARAIEVNKEGIESYLYWQPLLLRNPQRRTEARADFAGTVLRNTPPPEDILQVGVMIFLITAEDARAAHVNTVKQVLEREAVKVAIVGEGIQPVFSSGFPLMAGEIVASDSLTATDWLIRAADTVDGNRKLRVCVAVKSFIEGNQFAWVALLAALFLASFWHRSVFRETLLARSFASQLWLGLFAAAIVPITCVYTVNEWYAIEQKELKIAEERVGMISLFEQLERRQFMQETAEWEKLRAISASEQLQSVVDKIENPVAEDLKKIESVVRALAGIEHKFTGRSSFAEMIIFSRNGWQHSVYPNDMKHDASEFKRFINAFLKPLFSDLGINRDVSSSDAKPDGEAVKSEMTRDAGLQIFRTLFGVDNYFKLVHGLNLPLKLFYSTGNGCLKLIPLPGLDNLDKIVFWLFFDNLNSAMRRIFKNANTPYPVFTEARAMYGYLKHPRVGGWEADIPGLVRWSIAAKAPLSTRGMFAGRNCLVEARIGSHNETMIMAAMASEDEIFNTIENERRRFLVMLLISLIAIMVLTLLVSSDISLPVRHLITGVKHMSEQRFDYRINSARSDELGQMLQAFNGMACGLQERELMGQMVSRAARRVASDEESLRRAETGMHLQVTVMYLSVPGFDEQQKKLKADDLLARISTQIDVLCGIIMNNDGEADKIIGDKILAYFYSPEGCATSNVMAMNALQIIKDAEADGLLPFPVSIGIHAGDVIAGLLGISSKRDFTIIGDTVNVAARINARAAELPEYRYLISASAVENLASKASFESFGKVQLKGKAESVDLLRVRF